MTRVFIVDDHAVLREGIRLLLASEPAMHLVGEASNGQELLDQLPTTPADVVLLDVNMPVLDGLATAQLLRSSHPHIRILMLSVLDEARAIGEALAAGAHGYVLKNAHKQEISRGIRVLMSGQRFLCSEIGLRLLDSFTATADYSGTLFTRPGGSLISRREREVLRLVADGLTTQQIADQLFTSRRTIETHRQNILVKTGCKNTAALISWAGAHHFL